MSAARLMLFSGAANGFLSVTLGAFAAHGLKHRIDPQQMLIFDKAVDYQAVHALALLLTGLLLESSPDRLLTGAGVSFLLGILLFCGSLYGLALSAFHSLGIITPFGGMAFLIGWTLLAAACWRRS